MLSIPQAYIGRYGIKLGLLTLFLYAILLTVRSFFDRDTNFYLMIGISIFLFFWLVFIVVLPFLSYLIGKKRAFQRPIRSVFSFSLWYIFTQVATFYVAYFLAGYFEILQKFLLLSSPPGSGGPAEAILLIGLPFVALGVSLVSLLFGWFGYLDQKRGSNLFLTISIVVILLIPAVLGSLWVWERHQYKQFYEERRRATE